MNTSEMPCFSSAEKRVNAPLFGVFMLSERNCADGRSRKRGKTYKKTEKVN